MCETVKRTFISLLREGKDEEAYKFLHGEYYPLLLRFATAFLKTREPAEEVASDLLFKIWLKRESISEINNLRVYLLASVRNMCLTLLSKHKREQGLIEEMSSKKTISFADDPESIYISGELQEVIKRTISELPPRCKLIYEMIRVDRLRNKDVAAKLNISTNTIDVQLAIALKRLVEKINVFNQKKSLSKN